MKKSIFYLLLIIVFIAVIFLFYDEEMVVSSQKNKCGEVFTQEGSSTIWFNGINYPPQNQINAALSTAKDDAMAKALKKCPGICPAILKSWMGSNTKTNYADSNIMIIVTGEFECMNPEDDK